MPRSARGPLRISIAMARRRCCSPHSAGLFPPPAQVPDGATSFRSDRRTPSRWPATRCSAASATFEARIFFPSRGTSRRHGLQRVHQRRGGQTVLLRHRGIWVPTPYPAADRSYRHDTTAGRGCLAPHRVRPGHGLLGEQRLYLNGTKIATRAGEAADISDSATGRPLHRWPSIAPLSSPASFIGYLDTLRISDNVRYTGDSFTPPAFRRPHR